MKNIYKILLAVLLAACGFGLVGWGYQSTDNLVATTMLIVGNVVIILAIDIVFMSLARKYPFFLKN